MERVFDIELKELRDRLVYMSQVAEKMINLSICGLVERNKELAGQVFECEQEVNKLHIEVDELCIRLLALRQPIAADLRLITAAMKINNELERIGDQSVNISENTAIYLEHPALKPLIDIPRMVEITKEMVIDSITSFVNEDVGLARFVLKRDDEVDNLRNQIFHELLTYMLSDATTIQRALCIILISRNIERIADHATNICEDVVFLTLGKDIRHHAEKS
ncbi:MAG: phosphate signaling complex protein PhoU [Proteobacteria bacterium]|nr:phosphate signaling complex protein PhoU [Pseudomonadota bacterium]MBU1599563.1 phosphate signaling complex protein PhoU [bacterium]